MYLRRSHVVICARWCALLCDVAAAACVCNLRSLQATATRLQRAAAPRSLAACSPHQSVPTTAARIFACRDVGRSLVLHAGSEQTLTWTTRRCAMFWKQDSVDKSVLKGGRKKCYAVRTTGVRTCDLGASS
jgi:hypothetical protein